MATKDILLSLFEGKFDIVKDSLSEKAESVVSNIVLESTEVLLEMTPGHKEMMKQHLDNLKIVDDTPADKDA